MKPPAYIEVRALPEPAQAVAVARVEAAIAASRTARPVPPRRAGPWTDGDAEVYVDAAGVECYRRRE